MLQEVLSHRERAGFEVTVTLDQPADLIRRVVDDLVASARYQDLLIIHILGPARFDSGGELHFLAAGSSGTQTDATSVAARWLVDRLDDCRADRQAVTVDCWLARDAHVPTSWHIDFRQADEVRRDHTLVVMTVFRTHWSVGIDPRPPEIAQSDLTGALVTGLRTGWADHDLDGLVSVADIHAYVAERLRAAGATPPYIRTYGRRRDIFLARHDLLAAKDPLGRVVDEDVQFTVYRPRTVRPETWYPLLAFAHLGERRRDAPPEEPSPIEQVRALAANMLGEQATDYAGPSSESRAAVPKASELTFRPMMDGVTFNPSSRVFSWIEDVHKEEFRLCTDPGRTGILRGRLTVYLGVFILADIDLVLRVDHAAPPPPMPITDAHRGGPRTQRSDSPQLEAVQAKPYQTIFLSYSHRDTAIVEQHEQVGQALGNRYFRDRTTLLPGGPWRPQILELIGAADVFQLFWSSNSMHSDHVRMEYEYALELRRQDFVRPHYWEHPMPQSDDPELPPPALKALHFHALAGEEKRAACSGLM